MTKDRIDVTNSNAIDQGRESIINSITVLGYLLNDIPRSSLAMLET
jgi:hypothetical protein